MARKMEDISDVEGSDSSGKKSLRIEDFSVVVEGGRIGDMFDDIKKKEDLDCRERKTMVFWNMIKCPIPPDALPGVKSTISSALCGMGLHSRLLIYAYGDKSLLHQKDDFWKAGICYCVEREQLPEGEQKDADIQDYGELDLEVIVFSEQTYGRPADIMVIPKPDQHSELHRVLKCLQSRNHDVLQVNTPVGDSGDQFLESLESVVACTRGLDGEAEPITKPKCVCAYS
uniref:NYN domain-containing protein n=1 Tax=Noccaea caerulescens TaxID=107243 RepID=A0A1J3FTM2_NOCCA